VITRKSVEIDGKSSWKSRQDEEIGKEDERCLNARKSRRKAVALLFQRRLTSKKSHCICSEMALIHLKRSLNYYQK